MFQMTISNTLCIDFLSVILLLLPLPLMLLTCRNFPTHPGYSNPLQIRADEYILRSVFTNKLHEVEAIRAQLNHNLQEISLCSFTLASHSVTQCICRSHESVHDCSNERENGSNNIHCHGHTRVVPSTSRNLNIIRGGAGDLAVLHIGNNSRSRESIPQRFTRLRGVVTQLLDVAHLHPCVVCLSERSDGRSEGHHHTSIHSLSACHRLAVGIGVPHFLTRVTF